MRNFNRTVWLGADPGGRNKFGVSILRADLTAEASAVHCADAALDWFQSKLEGVVPTAVGIDAPLWWSSGPSGLRVADRRIRYKYRNLKSRNVQAGNSMWGAVLIQGCLVAHLLRNAYPEIKITETHPKALLNGWGRAEVENLFNRVKTNGGVTLGGANDDSGDALISAIAAREGFCGRWPEDLFSSLPESEQNPSATWLGSIHYYWPEILGKDDKKKGAKS